MAPLRLPTALHVFPSGVAVLRPAAADDAAVASALRDAVDALPGGATAIDAAEVLGAGVLSVALAAEYLRMAEHRGLLCRDHAPDGLRYWGNRFENFTGR